MTPELDGIVRYLDSVGARYRITDINTPGVHSATSYHYKGLALDLSGPHQPWMAEELLAVFAAFGAVENKLAELYYSGAPYGIKNGQRIRPGQSIIDTHWNHVHVAVPKGTILKEEPPMAVVPEDRRIVSVFPYEEGYVYVMADGAVYAFNCTYRGGLYWNGSDWKVR